MSNQINKYVKQAPAMGGPTATMPDSVKDLIARIPKKKLTYLTDKKLLSLSGGCRKATDEYLQTVPGEFLLDDSAGSMKITRSTSKPA